MPLNNEERAVLFNTEIIGHQLQKYLFGKGEIPFFQIKEVFYDVSAGRLRSYLIGLKTRGLLEINAAKDTYNYIGESIENIKGNIADKVWKAAVILKEFTTLDLVKISDATMRRAGALVNEWNKHGYIQYLGRKPHVKNTWVKVYKMVKPSQARPIIPDTRERKRRKVNEQ